MMVGATSLETQIPHLNQQGKLDNTLKYSLIELLSQPQLNQNSTRPNITKVGFDNNNNNNKKNISFITDPILTKL